MSKTEESMLDRLLERGTSDIDTKSNDEEETSILIDDAIGKKTQSWFMVDIFQRPMFLCPN